jgi:hypothetical protein
MYHKIFIIYVNMRNIWVILYTIILPDGYQNYDITLYLE